MKWKTLAASLVLSVGFCAQGYSFELLNTMLGVNGCCQPKCCAPKPKCCAPKPKCCAPKPCCRRNLLAELFSCNSGCKTKCCSPKPKCCAPKPKCCAPKPRCCAPKPKCCAPKPKCCRQSCCRRNLLAEIFSCKRSCNSGCGNGGCSTCGGGTSVEEVEAHGDAAPMPPAPVVDPSAFLPSNQQVFQASVR